MGKFGKSERHISALFSEGSVIAKTLKPAFLKAKERSPKPTFISTTVNLLLS